MKMYQHEASGRELAREIAQPHVTRFSEVFEDSAPYNVMTGKSKHPFAPRTLTGRAIATELYDDCKAIMTGRDKPRHTDKTMQVGPYCQRRDGGSFSVRCADWVLSRIAERTIIVPGDRMSFEIVDHENGWSLVVANHGSILGSVWLAYIKTDSIPSLEAGKKCVPAGFISDEAWSQ